MDGSHFDSLTRFLTHDHSRRMLPRLLSGLALGGSLALGRVETEAKKHKHHKKKHPGPRGLPCPAGQRLCGSTCMPNTQCCTDSDCPALAPNCCGGLCRNISSDVRHCGRCDAACGFNEQCLSGECRCGAREACPAAASCCPLSQCNCTGDFLNLLNCTTGPSCPAGSAECIASTNNCGPGGQAPAKACCPPGTRCDEGACRYV